MSKVETCSVILNCFKTGYRFCDILSPWLRHSSYYSSYEDSSIKDGGHRVRWAAKPKERRTSCFNHLHFPLPTRASIRIDHFGKYHDTLCLSRQILLKHCSCFPLGPFEDPRETGNNAYEKFGGTTKEYYGIFRSGLLAFVWGFELFDKTYVRVCVNLELT